MQADGNSLLILGVVLVTGVVAGGLARRLRIPAVTGQILGGVAIGNSGFALFREDEIHSLMPVTLFALALISVSIGGHLNLARLQNAGKRLFLLMLTEATVTPTVTLLALLAWGYGWPESLLFAAITVSTAPATVVALIKEMRARGVFVKTLIGGVAFNNVACILLFEAAYEAARVALDPQGQTSLTDLVLAPLWQLFASGVLGGSLGAALVVATRRVVVPERLATSAMVAILITCGLAIHLDISLLLSALFLGVAVSNLSRERQELGVLPFANFESAILAVFFTLAGIQLEVSHLLGAGGLVLLVFAARVIGKVVSAYSAMWMADSTARIRRYLGIALLPQAGVAVGLILIVQEDPALASVRDLFLTVGLALVTLNEIVGPFLTRYALIHAGDSGHDRPRLIDFLHEENIITGFTAETKEEAIEKLAGRLVSTAHREIDRGPLVESVLVRENEMSTCVGAGLAIPHGELDAGGEMVGVMGVSRDGLAFETPDGEPVHCIVLLATPSNQRDRHLEVLAALMRSVGADANVRRRLFNARSAAHAYEILHAEESVDFNYFLEALDDE